MSFLAYLNQNYKSKQCQLQATALSLNNRRRCTMNATTLGLAERGSSIDAASYGIYICLFILPFLVTYAFTVLGNTGYRDGTAAREPPKVPYWIPFVGNTIGFAYDTERFLFSSL